LPGGSGKLREKYGIALAKNAENHG
jgi:hypothetical protein